MSGREIERHCFVLERKPGFRVTDIRFTPNKTPRKNERCSEDIHVQHAVIFEKEGLITQTHIEFRDLSGDLWRLRFKKSQLIVNIQRIRKL